MSLAATIGLNKDVIVKQGACQTHFLPLYLYENKSRFVSWALDLLFLEGREDDAATIPWKTQKRWGSRVCFIIVWNPFSLLLFFPSLLTIKKRLYTQSGEGGPNKRSFYKHKQRHRVAISRKRSIHHSVGLGLVHTCRLGLPDYKTHIQVFFLEK